MSFGGVTAFSQCTFHIIICRKNSNQLLTDL